MKVDYEIHKSARRTASIKISDEGKVLLLVPLAYTETDALNLLKSKREWVLKHLPKVKEQNDIAQSKGQFSQKELRAIKRKARIVITERVNFYAEKSGISYNRIAIRSQRTRWGSCSADGNLNFNCLLVLMPEEIMDSVIIHELCHRRHMNHSKEFYDEINKYFPDYKRCRKWLNENGLSYLQRLPE